MNPALLCRALVSSTVARLALVVVCLVALAGVAHASDDTVAEPQFGPVGITTSEAEKIVLSSRPEPNLPQDEQSVALIKAFKERWDALIARDFAAAWAYETPEFRETVTASEFSGQIGPHVTWYGVEPIQIEQIDDDTVEIGFLVDHEITYFDEIRPIRFERYLTERWVHEKGGWWHQSQSFNIPGMAQDEPGQKP
ncbi:MULTISPECIES: hypothetical protein [Thiorhodovibrio]|uniref:hypothetical protein n=1 Tax=Thiorhodovibrio TaxID=61593 RepID=UPI001913F56B|nr:MULTISPECIES: hypothetical protein [Thiorhodovibrio]MBK5971215.1 hypothetical protein [Thiorhodovibrio winogradskyi]WPL14636.1 hypothetical protein Thiosp_04490 [Thiorhodovibrio litoralis]